MEVTRKNFKETLPLVTESIEKADFLVIDAEFTGLINGRDVSIFDTPEEYYTRYYDGASEFLLLQYGLCAFYWNEKEKHYMNDSYNFYLFPRGRSAERMFLCQSSSLDFLASQNFDFNKVIKDGISYMTEPVETKQRDYLTERQKLYSNEKESITIPEEHKQQIEDICKRVRNFIDKKESDEMEIDRCNAFVRRLLFQELGAKFKNEVFVETVVLENKNRTLKVSRVTSEVDSRSRDELKKDREWEEFEESVGFSKIARLISQSEKLVIGHNMLLDVMHTLSHFFQPLPPDYKAFKEFAHCMFPRLLDTKYMSSLPPFKEKISSSVLQHLYATLSEPPFSIPKIEAMPGRGYLRSHDRPHEAGYDAFVTGLCLLSMAAHLSRMRGERPQRLAADAPLLKPFLNKLYLAKTAHQDSPYINLAGNEPTPSRDHVFHLTFPKEWQRNDINQMFSPYGIITVQFIDDTSALIALGNRDQAKDVLRALSKSKSATLIPYAKYKYMQSKAAERDGETCRQVITLITDSRHRLATKPLRLPAQEVPQLVPRPQPVPQQIPQEVPRHSVSSPPRPRSTSVSLPTPPVTRKRTSSGVFQVDDIEPPAKKSEIESPTSLRPAEVNAREVKKETPQKRNGRRKSTDEKKPKKNTKEKDIPVIETFDKDTRPKCVSAFKESDSWD